MKTWSMEQLEGNYKTQGRVAVKDGILLLDYSASGLEFDVTGAGEIAVTFRAIQVLSGELGGCYFTVIVDGEQLPRETCHITERGDTTVTLAKALPAGRHTVRLYRQTEGEWATVGIRAVHLDGEPSRPADKALYIEFIGDSITTAFGNLTDNREETFRNPIWQDATKGYAYLTATALDADFSTVARQGIGASVGYQPVPMQIVYPFRCHMRDAVTLYDFARQPDLVVIALATNDMNAHQNAQLGHHKTLCEVKQGFADFLQLVREKNPKSKIVWAHGMMLDRADAMIAEVIDEAGGQAAGYYHVKLPQNNTGGQGHPHYTGHAQMAEVLTAFIKEIL